MTGIAEAEVFDMTGYTPGVRTNSKEEAEKRKAFLPRQAWREGCAGHQIVFFNPPPARVDKALNFISTTPVYKAFTVK